MKTLIALVAGLLLTGCQAQVAGAPVSPVAAASAVKAAPTTAAGYQALWAALDPCEWGAADTSLSVPLPDGRSVWLYSDTLSRCNGFVHSTAIVQTGGRLHVSHGGKQLIPNADSHHIYWIEQARRVSDTTIAVTTAKSRVALVTVSAAGDVTFLRWSGYVAMPTQYHDFTVVGPHMFTYENRPHPEARLASGKTLWTVCHNRDDGVIDYATMRPTFYER